MSKGRRSRGRKQTRRGRSVAAVAGWLIVLLAAFSLVTWRQARGVEMERTLRRVETERALVEVERVATERRIEEMSSRSRVVRVARDRLGMRVPDDAEIIFLPAVHVTGPPLEAAP